MSGTIQSIKPATVTRYFIGYSTQNSLTTGVRTLYDIDLINVDLANAFNTRVGERVMRPDYGCKLWDYLMEPMTPTLNQQIIDEATRICLLDSRLVMQNLDVLMVEHGFRIELILQYMPWLVIATFSMNFEDANMAYYNGGTALQ